MKRLLFIPFVLIYFVSSVGVNVLVHTCGGYRSVDFLPGSAEDPCGAACGDEMCCTLILQTIRIADDQQPSPPVTVSVPDCAVVEYPSADVHSQGAPAHDLSSGSPSPPSDVPATILNCVFLI